MVEKNGMDYIRQKYETLGQLAKGGFSTIHLIQEKRAKNVELNTNKFK